MWSIASVILLLAETGALVASYAKQFDDWREDILPAEGIAKSDFMDGAVITPSMKATAKYFWVVCALFLAQVLLGIVTAHYAVEGQGLYGLPFADYLPYAVTRTWHTQLACSGLQQHGSQRACMLRHYWPGVIRPINALA